MMSPGRAECKTRGAGSPRRILLMAHRYRRADGDRPEKILRHELRHPNAAVRSRITRQITGMHSRSSNDPHEIRHRRAFEMRAGRLRILADVDVSDHDVVRGIDVVAELAGDVILIFLDDLKRSRGGAHAFTAGRKLRNAH